MKKILLIIFLIVNLFSYDLKKVDFATFCNYVSYTLGKNIIISQDVSTSFSVFMPYDKMSSSALFRNFLLILRSKGLNYRIVDNTILVYKQKNKPNLYSSVIPFVFVPKKIIEKYLKTFYPHVKFIVFNNRLIITATKSDIKRIKFLINNLMSSYFQAKVNFLIIAIDNKKAKQLYSKLTFKNPFKHLLTSIVSNSVSFINNVPSPYVFSLFLNILNSRGISQTISKPSLNLIDSSNYTLESVHNIPYIQKQVTITKDGNPVTQSQIKYKDVGLKIYIKNVFITKRNIDFDMDIYVQNIISLQDNIPVIDTKHLNTHVQLTKKHSSYLLAGLRSITKISNKDNVPFLSKIPFFGVFFKNQSSNIEDISFAFYISTNFFKGDRK